MESDQIALPVLAQLLKCPVCLQYSSGEQYMQCRNGHSGCIECYSRLTECPVCRLSLVFPHMKANTLTEEILTALKTKIRHIENFNGDINIQNLLEYFKCLYCHRSPTRRPIQQCENVHFLCYECFWKTPACPICKKLTWPSIKRSLFAEKVLSLVNKSCRFKDHGCEAIIMELNDHEKEDCLYKDVKCVSIACQEIVSMSSLLDHLKDLRKEHYNLPFEISQPGDIVNNVRGSLELPGTFGNSNDTEFSCDQWNKVSYMKLDNKIFFFECWASNYFDNVIFWVHHLGSKKESYNFSFKLQLFKEDSSKRIEILGPVIPIEIPFNGIFRNIMSAKIHFDEIKKFWNQSDISFLWVCSVAGNSLAAQSKEVIINYS